MLTVLVTGSILAFSVQEAYSSKNWNSSKSNTSAVSTQLRADLMDLKSNFGVYLEGNNVESFIDIMIMELDEVQTGLDEMSEFYSALNIELETLKQTTELVTIENDSATVKLQSTERRVVDTKSLDEEHNAQDIKPKVPDWVQNNAKWYGEGLLTEDDFVQGLEWMINNGVIQLATPVGINEEGLQ